jgi:hypothetical protein
MHHQTKVLSIFVFIIIISLFNHSLKAQSHTVLPECNCSIIIPGTFKKYNDTFPTDLGKLIYHTYTMTDTTLNFQLSYIDYPEGSVHSDSSELLNDFFASTIDASVESVKGEKKYETDIQQFEYPGYFWKIYFGDNKFISTKSFVAGNRLYTLQVFGDRKQDKNAGLVRYFDSFRFVDLKKIK